MVTDRQGAAVCRDGDTQASGRRGVAGDRSCDRAEEGAEGKKRGREAAHSRGGEPEREDTERDSVVQLGRTTMRAVD
jgi:hypothetical protein